MHKDYDKSFLNESPRLVDGVTGPAKDEFRLSLLDRVDYGGMLGTVVNVDEGAWANNFSVKIKFDAGNLMYFTLDGRQFRQQTKTVLKIIGKAQETVTKWIYVWLGEDGEWNQTQYLTEKEAAQINSLNVIRIDPSEKAFPCQ